MSQPPYDHPGQQPFGGPPYGGAPYGGVMEHPQGTIVLVLGILSLVLCQLLGPVAWVMGNNAMAEIDRNPMGYSNRGSVQAGRICGIIATALLILSIVVLVLALVAVGASSD
jgi:Domain of unknown function (DUF4190)